MTIFCGSNYFFIIKQVKNKTKTKKKKIQLTYEITIIMDIVRCIRSGVDVRANNSDCTEKIQQFEMVKTSHFIISTQVLHVIQLKEKEERKKNKKFSKRKMYRYISQTKRVKKNETRKIKQTKIEEVKSMRIGSW